MVVKKAGLVAADYSHEVRPNNALTPLADARTFNADFQWERDGLPLYTPELVGDTIRGKPVLPHGENVPGTVRWQIDAGWSQDVSDGVITYGFANMKHAVGLNNNKDFGEGGGYTPFSAAQMAAARVAIGNWDDLIAARFVEVPQGPGASSYGRQTTDIMLANTTTGPAQAWAYYPGYENQYSRVSGDVWIASPSVNASNNQLLPGFYGLQTLNHELGHSLGLSHPGTYNFSDDNDGDGQPDPISYTGDAQYFQDSHQFSIMSYFDSYETGAQNIDWNLMRFVYPSTPMVDDVRVIQQKYGADMTTRTGDSTYGFNSTADVVNPAMKFANGEMFTIFTIWDAGGNDTLDFSGYATRSVIDLREGAYSSAGGYGAYDPNLIGTAPTLAEINANNVDAGLGARTAALFNIYFNGVPGTNEGISWKNITGTGDEYLMEQNIGIAYGAQIENGIGGSGDDKLVGNDLANRLVGNAGDDIFFGLAGNDALLGGIGNDTLDGGAGQDTLTGGEGGDTFVFGNIELGDLITDFTGADTIDLSGLGADLSYIGNAAFSGTAGEIRYDGGVLSGNFSGDLGADFSVTLSGAPALNPDQIILV